jgi:hypothetical protein
MPKKQEVNILNCFKGCNCVLKKFSSFLSDLRNIYRGAIREEFADPGSRFNPGFLG